jgi:hypothetical protein
MRRVYLRSRNGTASFLVAENEEELTTIIEKLRGLGIKYRY